MFRARTGSRLHFGLIGLDADAPRRSGGGGWLAGRRGWWGRGARGGGGSASGPRADRPLVSARRFAGSVGVARPQSLTVEEAPPEHVGLGTGTQLGLAV